LANLIYALPTDNLSPVATGGGTAWVVNTGTEDATYPAVNLADLNPAKPARLTTTTGSFLRDFGLAKQVDWVFIPMHNLTAALADVKIQGNATDSWGAPSLDEMMVVPSYHEDGFPVGFWLDLTGVSPRSFRYWRFSIGTANGTAVAIGEIWLVQTKRSLTHNIHWGLDETDEHGAVEHRTPYGVVSLFDLATKVRMIDGVTQTSDAGVALLKTWHRSCGGRAEPTAIVLDPAINDALMVRWATSQLAFTKLFTNANAVKLSFEEMSRGLVL
jgi:hypothetical protein